MRKPVSSGRPRPGRARGATPYVIRHGFGYTVFEHTENGIALRILDLRGDGCAGEVRRFQIAQHLRHRAAFPSPAIGNGCWAICGTKRCSTSRPRSISRPARCSRAIFTTREFPDRIVFLDVDEPTRTLTVIGRNFSAATGSWPAGGAQAGATFRKSRCGSGSCGAMQVDLRSCEAGTRNKFSSRGRSQRRPKCTI